MMRKIKVALLGILIGNNLIIPSFTAAQDIKDISFDILTQPRLFRGEELLEVGQELESPSSDILLKYLKLWPIFTILPTSGINSKEKDHVREFHCFLYNQCLPICPGNKFLEAKFRLAFACTIKPYEESAFKSSILAAERCLKTLMINKDSNKFGKRADSETLYWAWKHREIFPSLLDSVKDDSIKNWQDVLSLASTHPQPSARAQYALGRLLEKEEDKNEENPPKQQALEWYQKSARNGYKKAQFYLEYLAAKNGDITEQIELYRHLAEAKTLKSGYPKYPYAHYILGEQLLSSKGDEQISAPSESVKQGFTYLQGAARYGIKEAQKKLNEIRIQDRDLFYRLCNLSDNCKNDQERLRFLEERTEKNLAPYAHQLAQMCEDGRGLAYRTPSDWLKALEKAQQSYNLASLYNIEGAEAGIERIQRKISLLKEAQGYILDKIRKGITVSFTPQHPLFDHFSKFTSQLYNYSPGARYLGTCIIQQLIEECVSETRAETIIKHLLKQINSEEFQAAFKAQISEEREGIDLSGEDASSKEIEQATKFFNALLLTKAQPFQEGQSQTAEFLTRSKGFIFAKIEKGIAEDVEKGQAQALSPTHPLFKEFCEFIGELQKYPGSVPEHGAHLVQQLLYFPPHSIQAKVLINGLLDLVRSPKFREGEEEDTEEDLDQLRVTKLSKLNKALELTIKPRPLLSPKKEEKAGGIPEKLRVNKAMFRDPRIQVFNYFFEREEKTPFNRQEFEQSVESILKMYDYLYDQGKITENLLQDQDEKSRTYGQYGNREKLYRLLTNKKGFGDSIPNRFGHRLIKIRSILESGALDEETLANILSSWAVAGLNCQVRSQGETHKFYNMYITGGKSKENENDTLEVKVALSLADLRRQLLYKAVKEDEVEPLHKFNYLEKHGAKLGLTDPQNSQDPNEGIIPPYYRDLKTSTIQHAIWHGDATYRINIEPGKGYGNPTILIEYLVKVINDERSAIPIKMIRTRFKAQYKQDWRAYLEEYYNNDGRHITSEGARALLYSLGYLEKDLPILKKEVKW